MGVGNPGGTNTPAGTHPKGPRIKFFPELQQFSLWGMCTHDRQDTKGGVENTLVGGGLPPLSVSPMVMNRCQVICCMSSQRKVVFIKNDSGWSSISTPACQCIHIVASSRFHSFSVKFSLWAKTQKEFPQQSSRQESFAETMMCICLE